MDAVLREGTGHIDNSFITGEPLPVRKQAGDTIKAGGRQRGAAIELEVLRSFADSRLKRLWAEQSGGQERPAMPRLIDQVARRFTLAVLLIALGAGLYWWGKDARMIWPVVTAVLIVACPCALALSMPFAYGHTIRLLGKRGLFLRDAEVVERMAHVDAVLFDKTGTLTEREAHQVDWHGIKLSREDEQRIAALARNSAHPLSAVLAGKLKKSLKPDQDHLAPRAMTEVMEQIGQGIMGEVAGLPIRIGSADFTGGEAAVRSAGEAHVHVSFGGVHRGHFAIRKQARSGIVEAVRRLGASLRVGLITGDHQVDPDLAEVFPIGSIRMRCAPDEKSEAVKGLQRDGRRVLMVGDGLNDAGALAQADVGVTVTETTAALTPASDAIMDADSLQQLPHFLRMTRRARRIVLASLCISLLYNITGVSIAVAGHMTPLFAAILMPLSSVSVVGFVTVATMIAARNAHQ
ncbi:MAG: HAD-IC family P-type ATPase [Flavobacteriales bacterium]|nr:HAD-IC family P-type ATPase [Flavobacteriales bacterium]